MLTWERRARASRQGGLSGAAEKVSLFMASEAARLERAAGMVSRLVTPVKQEYVVTQAMVAAAAKAAAQEVR